MKVPRNTASKLIAVAVPAHYLTESEVSDIEKAITTAASGDWSFENYPCPCCGNTVIEISPGNAAAAPYFWISREKSGRIGLETTWFDGATYESDHWSISAAVKAVLSIMQSAETEMGLACCVIH